MPDDEDPVRDWQVGQLERTGRLSRGECEELVDEGCDWRLLLALLAVECPLPVALKIAR